jgi:hypothetical protein
LVLEFQLFVLYQGRKLFHTYFKIYANMIKKYIIEI